MYIYISIYLYVFLFLLINYIHCKAAFVSFCKKIKFVFTFGSGEWFIDFDLITVYWDMNKHYAQDVVCGMWRNEARRERVSSEENNMVQDKNSNLAFY